MYVFNVFKDHLCISLYVCILITLKYVNHCRGHFFQPVCKIFLQVVKNEEGLFCVLTMLPMQIHITVSEKTFFNMTAQKAWTVFKPISALFGGHFKI